MPNRFHRIFQKILSSKFGNNGNYNTTTTRESKPFENSLLAYTGFPCTVASQTRPSRSLCVDAPLLPAELVRALDSTLILPLKESPVYYGAHFANLMAGVPTGHTRDRQRAEREVVTSRGHDRLTVRTSF